MGCFFINLSQLRAKHFLQCFEYLVICFFRKKISSSFFFVHDILAMFPNKVKNNQYTKEHQCCWISLIQGSFYIYYYTE